MRLVIPDNTGPQHMGSPLHVLAPSFLSLGSVCLKCGQGFLVLSREILLFHLSSFHVAPENVKTWKSAGVILAQGNVFSSW